MSDLTPAQRATLKALCDDTGWHIDGWTLEGGVLAFVGARSLSYLVQADGRAQVISVGPSMGNPGAEQLRWGA